MCFGMEVSMTVSLCMIVKNEEAVLARCLDSVADLVDEIVIVDTGSTDSTREIAAGYTDNIYDFEWIDDFAAARNYAFAKCTKDYIYCADADEVLDEENREAFRKLTKALDGEVDIVQMYYDNQLHHGSIYNFDKELRPKMYKRLREFVWEEPVHEQVRLHPIVFDSEIVITHKPEKTHSDRDIKIFEKMINEGRHISKRLHSIYAKELYVSGTKEDFVKASVFFKGSCSDTTRSADEVLEASCVVARAARLSGDIGMLMKYALKGVASEGCSEICCELGEYFLSAGDLEEAIVWFYNAAFQTVPIISKACGGSLPKERLVTIYNRLGMPEEAEKYMN